MQNDNAASALKAWQDRIRPTFDAGFKKFKSLSLLARTGVVTLFAAFCAGVFGSIGESAWAWLITPEYVEPVTADEEIKPELTDAEKVALFAKRYPGVRFDVGAHSSEDGSFESFERDRKILDGNWQVSSGIFVGRRFVPLRIVFSGESIMTARVAGLGCTGDYGVKTVKDSDAIILKKTAASGGWCAQALALEISSITDQSVAMNVYMSDGSVNGPNILIKALEDL
jgi:hypothetical protein